MKKIMPQLLITGSNGFIGKNLKLRLYELKKYKVDTFDKDDKINSLQSLVKKADTIIHLAGVNRPENVTEFKKVNVDLTKVLCDEIFNYNKLTDHKCKLILVSSTQATLKNNYGESKLEAEKIVLELEKKMKNSVKIFRLPGVFGKFCKPNYNSVVATFCQNVIEGMPLSINEPNKVLTLTYIDDVINQLIKAANTKDFIIPYGKVKKVFKIKIETLAKKIEYFHNDRFKLKVAQVGSGIDRALYATYLSHLPKKKFSYIIKENIDYRGTFVEMLKTQNSGQISFLTAKPGITRGGHYHHTKSEKFLVIRGKALFKFKNVINNDSFEILTSSKKMEIVETIPGWAHDITNVGNNELYAIIWANEVFDHNIPDTFATEI